MPHPRELYARDFAHRTIKYSILCWYIKCYFSYISHSRANQSHFSKVISWDCQGASGELGTATRVRAIFVPTIFLFRLTKGLRDSNLKPVLAMGISSFDKRRDTPVSTGLGQKLPQTILSEYTDTLRKSWNSVESLPSGILSSEIFSLYSNSRVRYSRGDR